MRVPVGFGRRWPLAGTRASAAASALAICAATLMATPNAGASPGALARSARTLSLSESGHLHLTSHHGFTLNEEGSATGTIRGKIYIHLTVSSTNRVSAVVNIYPSNGSLTGYARASYHVAGATASFSGSMSVVRGTGTYRHAKGTGLSFSGTIHRSNDAVSVRLSGRMSD